MPLARYSGVAFVVDANDHVVIAPLAAVVVRREDTGALASLFSDRDGSAGLANPFTADAEGRFSFHVAGLKDGYRITVTEAGSPGLEYAHRYVPMGTFAEIDNPATTKGDILAAISGGALTRKGVAAAPALLVPNATEPDGLEWFAPVGSPINDTDGFVPAIQSEHARGLVFMPPPMGFNLVGGYLDWSTVGSPTSTLSVAIKTWRGQDPSSTEPVFIPFRSGTAGIGGITYRKITAATSITIDDTALLGTVSGIAFRLWCVAFDDGGTIRLALINCITSSAGSGAGRTVTSIFALAGWGIASATQEGTGADSAGVFYSNGAAVASKAYATLGYATWESGLPNAGNWNSDPTREQLFGPGVPLPGSVIQVQRTSTGAVATGTTVTPADDSIPQITEGDQYMSQAITPGSSANVLEVEARGHFSVTTGNGYIMALHQDATANAVTAIKCGAGGADSVAYQIPPHLLHAMLALVIVATTMRIRAGGPGGTLTFNGSSGSRLVGGVMNSYLTVKEIMG